MSHFFGEITGSSLRNGSGTTTTKYTKATRGGTAKEGLEVRLRSNEGSLRVSLYEGEAADGGLEDRVTIRFESCRAFGQSPYPGPVVGHNHTIYSGPISEVDFNSVYLPQESDG